MTKGCRPKRNSLEGDIGPFSLTPLPPGLNGTSRMGTYKIGHWPPPPSSNRDKLHFSRDELVNTHWPLLILSGMVIGLIWFFFNIIFYNLPLVKDTYAKMYNHLKCDIENFHNVSHQKLPKIVRKQKLDEGIFLALILAWFIKKIVAKSDLAITL